MVLVAIGCLASSQAATVGHWAFENNLDLGADSGPNNLGLTNSNVGGIAALFPSSVPFSGSPNTGAGDFEVDTPGFLSGADNAVFAVQNFTIEAYVKLESGGSGTTVRAIASQFNSGAAAAQSWQLGVAGAGSSLGNRRLFMQLSGNGVDLVNFAPTTGFTLTAGSNYYVAASVRFTGTTIETTFYLQDLTAGGNLLSTTVSSTAASLLGGLYDSNANFAIGASYNNGAASRHFDGTIDEVRLSNTALSPGELLAIPEPSAISLLGMGGLAVAFRRRRGK